MTIKWTTIVNNYLYIWKKKIWKIYFLTKDTKNRRQISNKCQNDNTCMCHNSNVLCQFEIYHTFLATLIVHKSQNQPSSATESMYSTLFEKEHTRKKNYTKHFDLTAWDINRLCLCDNEYSFQIALPRDSSHKCAIRVED